jgi:hypothetical protein
MVLFRAAKGRLWGRIDLLDRAKGSPKDGGKLFIGPAIRRRGKSGIPGAAVLFPPPQNGVSFGLKYMIYPIPFEVLNEQNGKDVSSSITTKGE